MENNGEIRIHPCEPLVAGEVCLFVVTERFDSKNIYRKVYDNKHDGLYIMYKGKRYFEFEFTYYKE